MKRTKAYSAYLAFVLAALAFCSGQLSAGAPLKINFQGRLDESGAPAEGSKTFVFKIYDAASGGALVWTSQSQPLTLSEGVFSAVLSAGTPAALSTAAFSGARYVEITVDGVTLSPRQEMVSAPYALVAQALAPDAELPAAAIADGSVSDLKVALSTAAIGSGRFTDGRLYLSTGAFYGGFNAADKLVQLDGSGRLPALDGSALTNVNASQLSTLAQSTAPLARAGDWDAAFGWGDHGAAGYAAGAAVGAATATLRTDLSAVIASTAPLANAANWNAAYTQITGTDYATQAELDAAMAGVPSLSSTQTFSGSATFSSSAAFTAQGAAPGVTVSSGLVVLNGPVGLGTAAPSSTLSLGGSLSLPIRRIVASASANAGDHTILADATGGSLTVTLPPAAGAAGRVYVIKRVSAVNNVTVDSAGGLVEGAASQVMNSLQGETMILQSDGTDWHMLSWYWQ